MASESQTMQKRLEAELAKPTPNPDVVYFLNTTRPYWNTIDRDAMNRGADKVYGDSLQRTLGKLAPKKETT